MELIIKHECKECGFVGEVEVKDRKVICPQCGTKNDIWLKGEIPPINHRRIK